MKNLFIVFALLICFSPISLAQLWVDQVYDVDTITDVQYGSALNFNNNSVDLHVDIYSPKCQDTATKRPLMMVVHGGGFIAGSYKDGSIQDICAQFARRGYVAVSVQYRLGYVNDNSFNNCNLVPDFPCLFATDTMEWERAYYRAIQDVKGAMRYMINRKDVYHIDENNVFLVGESAGSFAVMGAAYMDDASERPAATFAIADAPEPNSNTGSCPHNIGQVFSGPIPRPDLGGIDGSIEPALYPFTIRGVGDMYGGMFTDLLSVHSSAVKPALYAFHQKDDIVVPIGTNDVYYGVAFCYANCGTSCSYIYHTPIVHGSQIIDEWNTNQSLGYDIQTEFPGSPFTYDCFDCLNNSSHGYINKSMTMTNMATFFATKIDNPETCVPFNSIQSLENDGLLVYPNPVLDVLHVKSDERIETILILDLSGKILQEFRVNDVLFESSLGELASGFYMIECTFENDRKQKTFIKK